MHLFSMLRQGRSEQRRGGRYPLDEDAMAGTDVRDGLLGRDHQGVVSARDRGHRLVPAANEQRI